MSISCTSCNCTLRPGLLFGDKVFTCESSAACCPNVLCKTCFVQRPLLIVPDTKSNSVDDDNHGGRNDLNAGRIKRLCRTCFESQSTLNYATTYDYQPSRSGTTFVFTHAASGCRRMFASYADYLHTHHQHGYLLIDLPGHGTCVDLPLSLESCVEHVREILSVCRLFLLDKNAAAASPERLIYVGASLGAYVGFHVLAELLKDEKNNNNNKEDVGPPQQHPRRLFHGAVLMDCGQNVGPGSGMAARFGLVVLRMLATNSSNYALMKLMLPAITKNIAKDNNDYHLVDGVFGAGMWFDQVANHVQCLQDVAPATLLPHIPIPILYLNGSLDHRDCENKWLNLSAAPHSKLKVYEGGDHFFTHDRRFIDDIFAQIIEFVNTI
jgi:pimeloyl-ACP methyl ester carboxylesterase